MQKRARRCLRGEDARELPPVGVPPAGKKKEEILKRADAELAAIAIAIQKGQAVPPSFAPVSTLLQYLLYRPFSKNVHGMGTSFFVEDTCTSCGTCVTVCPAGNIRMENDRPVFLDRCELCCACLNFCPVEAIQLNFFRGTKGRGRYRHPDLKVEDMKAQRGEKTATTQERNVS